MTKNIDFFLDTNFPQLAYMYMYITLYTYPSLLVLCCYQDCPVYVCGNTILPFKLFLSNQLLCSDVASSTVPGVCALHGLL